MSRRHVHGIALPVSLFILALVTLLGLETYRTAVAQARIMQALAAQQTAAELAHGGAALTLRRIGANLALLPAAGAVVALPRLDEPVGTVERRVEFLGSDAVCPALGVADVIREHYELSLVSTVPRAAELHLRQGFYVCREICVAPCTALTGAPRRTYWSVGAR